MLAERAVTWRPASLPRCVSVCTLPRMHTAAVMTPQKEISRGVVSIYKDYLGRGPTSVRTSITEDASITTVEDSLIKAERSLVSSGEGETVRETRRKFQCAMREDITALVERVTERQCVAFLSDHDTEADVAVEMVVFAPLADS